MRAYRGALIRFYECMEDYLDDHKENAFNSSFKEPARYYWTVSGQEDMADNVEVHASNWFIALLNSTLGVHLPLQSSYWDVSASFAVDFWAGLKEEAWTVFSDPSKFGVGFHRHRQLQEESDKYITSRATVNPYSSGEFPKGNTDPGSAKHFANQAVKYQGGFSSQLRRQIAVYLERFAHFFSSQFFVRKAFEVLFSELKPEHTGFRKACETLYAVYRCEQNCSEETLIEYVYNDELYTDFNLEHAECFFVWCGVLKPATRKLSSAGARTIISRHTSSDRSMRPQ